MSFYRIYRDGERYDRVSANTLHYTDTSPTADEHRYHVTAVDSSYNESNAIGPAIWVDLS